MSLPPLLRELVQRKLDTFFDWRVPAEVRDEIQLVHRVRGQSVTIWERRPPWDGRGNWTEQPVAQIRYDDKLGAWLLYCSDRNSRWHRFEPLEPTADLDEVIEMIDEDPTGIFWG